MIGTYTAKKPFVYDYEIVIKKYKNGVLRIDVENDMFDSHGYAFIREDDLDINAIYSYSPTAVSYVKRACEAAGIFDR